MEKTISSNPKTFGEFIANERKTRKLTTKELAAKAGISPMALSRIENDMQKLYSVQMIEKVAKGLEIKKEDLTAIAAKFDVL